MNNNNLELSNDQESEIEKLSDNFRETLQRISETVEQISSITNITEMTTLNIEPLKYLSRLPELDGSFDRLQNFIDLINRIYPTLQTYNEVSQLVFLDVIKSKLIGKAREVMDINYHVNSWPEIKTLLNHNFGDKKSSDQLFDELRSIPFRTNSQDMYNEIKGILRRLNVKTTNESNTNDENLKSLLKANINSALEIFKRKLPEPMKSILYCRAPEDLEAAINIIHESGYAYYNPYNRTQRVHNAFGNYNRNTDSRQGYNNFNRQPQNLQVNSRPRGRNNFSSEGRTSPRYNIASQIPNNNNLQQRFNNNPSNNNNSYRYNSTSNGSTTNRNNYNPQQRFSYNRYPYGPNNNQSNNNGNFSQNTGHNNPTYYNNTNNSNSVPTSEPMEVDMLQANRNEAIGHLPENFRSPASPTLYPI